MKHRGIPVMLLVFILPTPSCKLILPGLFLSHAKKPEACLPGLTANSYGKAGLQKSNCMPG
jgi:hypothetical protein